MTFDEIKAQAGSRLVMFYSLTCAPCKAMKPQLSALCAARGVELHLVNIASDMDAVRALGIRGVPALVHAGDGQAKLLSMGGLALAQMTQLLERENFSREGA